jgi:hypothetical protein
LNRQNPKTRQARKPINAIRMFKILPRAPRPRNPKKVEITPNTASSNHITPVRNPRKAPQILQEE